MDKKNAKRWQQIDALLDRFLDLPGEDRTAFLGQLEQDHPSLHEQFRNLLQAGRQADDLFDNPGGDDVFEVLNDFHQARRQTPPPAAPPDEWKGRRIGHYRILRPIGRGGMGQVFLAQRDDEVFKNCLLYTSDAADE